MINFAVVIGKIEGVKHMLEKGAIVKNFAVIEAGKRTWKCG